MITPQFIVSLIVVCFILVKTTRQATNLKEFSTSFESAFCLLQVDRIKYCGE